MSLSVVRSHSVLLITVAMLVTACARPEGSLSQVQARGVLRVGLDASFPPFESVTADGELQGLDVDLARLLAADLGLEPGFRNIAFDGLYDALSAGEVDIVISALPYDPLRTRDVAYGPAYFQDGLVVIEGKAYIKPETDTGSQVIAVEMGSEASLLARDLAADDAILELLSEAEVIASVAEGRAGRGLVYRVEACAARTDGAPIAISRDLTEEGYHVAARAQDLSLVAAVNAALARVITTEAWQRALVQWIGEGC